MTAASGSCKFVRPGDAVVADALEVIAAGLTAAGHAGAARQARRAARRLRALNRLVTDLSTQLTQQPGGLRARSRQQD